VKEECSDPDWAIARHPGRELLEKFNEAFKSWLQNLQIIFEMQCGGCPIEANELSPLDWRALNILKVFKQAREHHGS